MQEVVKLMAIYMVYFAEIAAAIVILIGAIQAIWIYFKAILGRRDCFNDLNQSRLKLGYSLSLGLGFLVGADVIKSAVTPTWHEIGILGAVVGIRIILNFFLMKDLKDLENATPKEKLEC